MANAAGGSRSVCVEAQELKHLLQGAAWLRYVVPEAGNSVLELVGITTAVQEDDGRVSVAQVLHCSLAVHEETPEAGTFSNPPHLQCQHRVMSTNDSVPLALCCRLRRCRQNGSAVPDWPTAENIQCQLLGDLAASCEEHAARR